MNENMNEAVETKQQLTPKEELINSFARPGEVFLKNDFIHSGRGVKRIAELGKLYSNYQLRLIPQMVTGTSINARIVDQEEWIDENFPGNPNGWARAVYGTPKKK